MERNLLQYFFNCGDDGIIQYALSRAHLNKKELTVIRLMFDECMTQEQIAEVLEYSVRRVQQFWYSGAAKLLNIPWVLSYSVALKDGPPFL